jgi:hypothetical protein
MSLCIVQAIAALFLIYMCVLYKYWTVLCGQQVGNYLELNTFLFVCWVSETVGAIIS